MFALTSYGSEIVRVGRNFFVRAGEPAPRPDDQTPLIVLRRRPVEIDDLREEESGGQWPAGQ